MTEDRTSLWFSITYKAGGSFTIGADNLEDLTGLYNLAQKTLWGDRADALTITEMEQWLGWS